MYIAVVLNVHLLVKLSAEVHEPEATDSNCVAPIAPHIASASRLLGVHVSNPSQADMKRTINGPTTSSSAPIAQTMTPQHPSERWETAFVYAFICKFTSVKKKMEGFDTAMECVA